MPPHKRKKYRATVAAGKGGMKQGGAGRGIAMVRRLSLTRHIFRRPKKAPLLKAAH